MFQRYTEKARRTIFFARYEASQFGSPKIEPEHLLLGIVRDDKAMLAWLPKTNSEKIRRQIEENWKDRKSIPTSVDLPLSPASQRVLRQASDEADRLASKTIGVEHLFLALIQEKGCLAAKILQEGGADSATIRAHYADKYQSTRPWSFQRGSYFDSGFRRLSADTVEIHGARWNVDYIRDVTALCRSYKWHWRMAVWMPRDIVMHRQNGTFSFDLGLAADSENFELVKLGWKKDHCFVCRWEFFESEDEHGKGYTNGHDWLCIECCERFLQRPDFFTSSQSEMT